MTARTIPTAFVHRYLAFSPDNDVDLSGALRAAGIDPMRRAETLTIEEWTRLME